MESPPEAHPAEVAQRVVRLEPELGTERAIQPLESLRKRTQLSRIKTYCEEALARVRQGTDGPKAAKTKKGK